MYNSHLLNFPFENLTFVFQMRLLREFLAMPIFAAPRKILLKMLKIQLVTHAFADRCSGKPSRKIEITNENFPNAANFLIISGIFGLFRNTQWESIIRCETFFILVQGI